MVSWLGKDEQDFGDFDVLDRIWVVLLFCGRILVFFGRIL